MPTSEKELIAARNRYRVLVSSGKCTCCGKDRQRSYTLCAECTTRKKPAWRRSMTRKYAARKASGLCARCCAPLHPEADAGKIYCISCSQQRTIHYIKFR